MTNGRVVVALGGNALLRRGEPAEAETQRRHVLEAAHELGSVAHDFELVLTHGNGPQVGLLALEAEAYREVAPYPLDVLVAESQGMIGYLLAQALRRAIAPREVVTLLTQVVVEADDPAFEAPSKPIGPVYAEAEARALAAARGWSVAPDGDFFRRVVPSPEPRRIVELAAIDSLIAAGAVVVCSGGGGIPVVETTMGLRGVEAVIDKDLTAAVLAEAVGAERLVLATDVPYVQRGFGTDEPDDLAFATSDELRRMRFAAGSMGPKVAAACRFVDRTGGEAVIGALSDIDALVSGAAGTLIARRAAPART